MNPGKLRAILAWLKRRNTGIREFKDHTDDPVDIDELIAGLREDGITIPADRIGSIKTVGDAIQFLEELD
ncbi:MAG TPA: hypothetical protein VND64_20275 [Pirellulales bacterium]|nr:hypothetical protein [Pirellulales bacterium]